MATGLVRKDSSLPLFQQVKSYLFDLIRTLRPGEQIPTEGELQRELGVSRATVRKAMDDLVAAGMLIRIQGKGTFVSQPRIEEQLGHITSFTEQMERLGKKVETTVLALKEEEPRAVIRAILELREDETVVVVQRLRCVDGVPISVITNYLPSRFVPGLTAEGLDDSSLYRILEKRYGYQFHKAEETIEATGAPPDVARWLGLEPGAPSLLVTRLSSNPAGFLIDYSHTYFHPQRYKYRVSLTGRT